MVETETPPAAAAAPAPPAKVPRKKGPKPNKRSSPGAAELILRALAASKDRKGVSFAALKKTLAAGGYDVEHNIGHIKRALKKLVVKKEVVQVKGVGASGSFKLAKTAVKTKADANKGAAKTVSRVKKSVGKKVQKPKAATPKKRGNLPTKKLAAKTQSPKKAARKDAKKAARKDAKKASRKDAKKAVRKSAPKKKAVSPRKADKPKNKKSPAKKVMKKPAAKKAPAKKPAKK